MNPQQLLLMVIIVLAVAVGTTCTNMLERAKSRFEFVVSLIIILFCLGVVAAASLGLYSK